MTDDPDADAPMLPGLAVDTGPGHVSPLLLSVRRTFKALDAAGLLREEHAATMELCLYLADTIGNSRVHRGASVAMLVRELRESLALLPERIDDADGDILRDFEADFRAAGLRHPS